MKMSQLRNLVAISTKQSGRLWENFVIETYKLHKVLPAHSLDADFEAHNNLICFITFDNKN